MKELIWKCMDRFGLLLGIALILGGMLGWHLTLSEGGTVAVGMLVILVAATD